MKYASNFDHQTVFVIYHRPIDIRSLEDIGNKMKSN